MGTWQGSILAALVATLERPGWWVMALAAFLVRGGILLVLLPIILLPTPAALATELAPTIQGFVFGGLTPERILLVLAVGAVLFLVLGAAWLAGAWLDLAQLREAADDEDLRLGWVPAHPSVRQALRLRLVAHLPTLVVLAYATVRLIGAAYQELLSPGYSSASIFLRVLLRAPEAVVLLVLTWLVGETIGTLAARRATAGAGGWESLWRSTRQIVTPRGIATLGLTTAVVGVVLVPFLMALGRAWEHLREAILADAGAVPVGAAVVVLVASWILGLVALGVALAWRGAAWTAEVAPAARAVEQPATPAPAEAEATAG